MFFGASSEAAFKFLKTLSGNLHTLDIPLEQLEKPATAAVAQSIWDVMAQKRFFHSALFERLQMPHFNNTSSICVDVPGPRQRL